MLVGKRVDGSKPGIEGFFGAIFGDDSKATQVLTNAASSSPIQRTVTSIDGVLVSQDITLGVRDPRVDQRVTLNKDAYLRLSASASTNTASNSVRLCLSSCVCMWSELCGPHRAGNTFTAPFRFIL